MKKTRPSARAKAAEGRDYILAACERVRQQCNSLSDEERRQLRLKALRIIYGHDAQPDARSR